jgi:hypothetical protein
MSESSKNKAMRSKGATAAPRSCASVAAALLGAFTISASMAQGDPTTTATVGVGAQYDTTHVYLAAGDLDAFVNCFVATFGGKPSAG